MNTFTRKVTTGILFVLITVGSIFACAATTQKGTQCKRSAQNGSEYCWQHERMYGSSSKTNDAARCKAITQKGTQCSRNASDGTTFCWQHVNSTNTVKPATKVQSAEKKAVAGEATSTQCEAITKKGTQCSRKATNGNYCWQHAQ